MRTLALLAVLFVVLPVAELALLLRVGRAIGFWPTLTLVLFTGVVGAMLARLEGTRTLLAFRGQLARGGIPGQPLMDGACVLVGGALLLTPGFLTDAVGFALLLPPTRRWIQRFVRRRIEDGVEAGTIQVAMAGGGGGMWWAAGRGAGPASGERVDSGPADEGEILEAEVVETRPGPRKG